nr:ARID DNA-binding domain-containing protein [Tanacetum cinerariifolium]
MIIFSFVEMEVLQYEHPLTFIDLNPEYPRDEVVYDDEDELIMKQDFRCPCGRCGQEINFYHWYVSCNLMKIFGFINSHGSDNGGRQKPIHSRDQIGVSMKYLQRETPQRSLPWNRKKSLPPGCKEMLLMRMKEIEAFNASKNTADQEEESDRKEITQKEKRARCYVCKMRGHVYWKCPNKKKKDLFKHKGIEKPTYKKAADKIKYPEKVKYLEKVHVITDYMIKGTSEATGNEIWYVSSAYKHHMSPTRSLFEKLKYKFKMIGKEETEKKFIFSYGIGDAQMEAKEGTFLIPNVHYTPEVTLNIMSHDLLEEQGYVVEIRNNKCNIHYMVGRKGKEKVQEGSSTDDDRLMDAVTKHNKYLEKYFESIKPKEELSLMKGLEDLKWDKDDVQDYVDEE